MALDDVNEWLVFDQILLRVGGVENHDSTKFLGVSALEQIDQVDHIVWRNIHVRVVGECGQRRGRKTDVQLNVLVHGCGTYEAHPRIETDGAGLPTNTAVRSVKVGPS